MKTYSSISGRSAQQGFSMAEVLVGMVISLLATIIIFQVFEVSEKVKRSSTGGGDAQQNGAAGLFYLERALREAGYGLNADDVNPVPVLITANAATLSDSITITYRQNWNFGPFSPDVLAFPSAVPPVPTVETFSVGLAANGQPVLQSNVNGVIADGIVQLKAQYGYDQNGNRIVDSTEWTSGAVPAALAMNVKAVRLVLVARSSQGDKPPSVGGCTTTTGVLGWNGGNVDLSGQLGLTGTNEWQCYRYKAFEITVPLRNVIWKP